jgi:hypothetical protein
VDPVLFSTADLVSRVQLGTYHWSLHPGVWSKKSTHAHETQDISHFPGVLDPPAIQLLTAFSQVVP